MAKAPIDVMLDRIEWQEVVHEKKPEGRYATHHGVLVIEGHRLRCYILDDGQRVFYVDDVESFFGSSHGG